MSLLSPSNEKEAARSGAILLPTLWLLQDVAGMGIWGIIFWLVSIWGWVFLAGYSLFGAVIGFLLYRMGEIPMPLAGQGLVRSLAFRLAVMGAVLFTSRAFLPTLSWIELAEGTFVLPVVLSLFGWKFGARWERATVDTSLRNGHLGLALLLVPLSLAVLERSKKDTQLNESWANVKFSGALEGSLSGWATFVQDTRSFPLHGEVHALFFRFQMTGPEKGVVEFRLEPAGEKAAGVFQMQDSSTADSKDRQNLVRDASVSFSNGRDLLNYTVRQGTVTVTRTTTRAIEGTFDLVTEEQSTLHEIDRLRGDTPSKPVRVQGTFRAILRGR